MNELSNYNNKLSSIKAQGVLEESEANYELLLDSIKDYAIFMLSPQGYVKTWNSGAAKLIGYTRAEIINKHFSMFYTLDAIERNHPEYELEMAIKEGRFEEEGWRLKKNGKKFWASMIITPIYNNENKHIGFTKVTRDLTERKVLEDELLKTNEALKESEARARLLIAGVKDYAIFLLNPEGKIASWNEGAKRIKGYAPEEIIGKSFSIFYDEEAIGSQYPQFELAKALEEGRFEDEGWRIKKDGTKFWANVVITPIYNSENKHIGFTKVTRDLTDRKRLEDELRKANEELKESEERSRLLIAGVKDYAIFLLNIDGKIASWNEGAEKIKGYTAEEVIGKSFSIFYTPEAVESQYPQFELTKALEGGRFEDEGWRVRKDGTKFWANVVITSIYNSENKHIGFTKITRDLTERVRSKYLNEKNLELHKINTDLDNFVYTASHDLKSPIANMQGFLTLLKSKVSPKLDESEGQIVQMMENCVLKLNKTIESLVEVTKSQKNLEEKVEVISFKEVLDDVKEEISTAIANANAEIKETFNVKGLTFARASLRSIIYNLLSNAIKYRSPDKRPRIEIRTYKEGGKTILSIKDNGLGLTKSQEKKMFTMFKRFHTHVEGTGIGLYIVKRTIENAGGKIEINSKLHEGTEFKLHFNTH